MNGNLFKQVRVEQSCRRLDGLRTQVKKWLDCRRDLDKLDQYATQLNVLQVALLGPLDELRSLVGGPVAGQATGRVFAACRANDTRVELVRRVFTYYRAKFDQHDDATLGPVLRAADEVIWSCWAEPFRNSARPGLPAAIKPVPLPYIEPQYSPEAIPRQEPPADLVAERDDAILTKYLERLPIPVVALPAVCADDPWWLVYVGHEVGHHLQFDLSDSWGLVKAFGELVETTTRAARAPSPSKWRSWAPEIFADIFSVHAMGAAAVFGIVQLELNDEEKMRAGKFKYPPPLVRLQILATVADRLGLDVSAALQPVDFAGLHGADLAGTQDVVAALVDDALSDGALGTRGSFRTLFDWDSSFYDPGGLVWGLCEGFRNRAPLVIDSGVRAPRLLTSAAVAAWQQVAAIEDPDVREEERSALAERFYPAVAAGREEITRDSSGAGPDVTALRGELTRLLVEGIREDEQDEEE
jgi:hypothetical protein